MSDIETKKKLWAIYRYRDIKVYNECLAVFNEPNAHEYTNKDIYEKFLVIINKSKKVKKAFILLKKITGFDFEITPKNIWLFFYAPKKISFTSFVKKKYKVMI